MSSFLHSGKIGDLIYALPVIKRLGGGRLYLCSRDGLPPITNQVFESIKPLLVAQDYIENVEMHRGQKVTHDFTGFRSAYDPHRTLIEAQAAHVCPQKAPDLKSAWLTATTSDFHGRPVIARSPRYHNPEWDSIWPEVLRQHSNPLLVGLPSEHEAFCMRFGKVEFRRTSNFLEMAQLIQGSSVFIGNQSAPYAVAEGLKHNSVQETSRAVQDCVFPRPNAHFISARRDWEKIRGGVSIPILLALQTYPGDVYQAMELVRLMADIEPVFRKDVTLLISSRRDTNQHAVKDIANEAQKKFNVIIYKGKRRGTGWPMGCNDLWQETMDHVYQLRKSGQLKAEVCLTFEPDCVPFRPDWIDILKSEWMRAKALGKLCVGHCHNEPKTHINGNALFATDIMGKHSSLGDADPRTGWDVFSGPLLLKIGADTDFISQLYRMKRIERTDIERIRKNDKIPALFHGVKSVSGFNVIREMIADGDFYRRIDTQAITAAPEPDTEVDRSGRFLISVLCLNRLHATKTCIEAVTRNSKPEDYHLVITDNGSTDGTHEYLQSLVDLLPPSAVTIVSHRENTGFIDPNNFAFDFAVQQGYRYFVALNNDTVPPPGWLDKLRDPLDRSEKAALSGPRGGCHSLKDNFHGTGGGAFEYVEGSCLCAKVEIVKQYGSLFSPYLDFIYGDDSDLSLRMREKGYTIHQADFDLPHARGETVQKQPEVKERCDKAQAHNHAVLTKRWAHYIKTRRMDYPIVLRRDFAIGDVLLLTPIIKAIKASNPLSPIFVDTKFPDVFIGNPHVEQAGPATKAFNAAMGDALILDFNMAYENRPMMHIVEAYEQIAREALPALGEVALVTKLYPSEESLSSIKSMLSKERKGKRICVVHADETDWPGKNYHQDKWTELIKTLIVNEWEVIAVGKKPPEFYSQNFCGKTTINQLAALLRQADLFIGIDSFPMNAALAVGCPTIGLFGVSSARFIMTNGAVHIGIEADQSIPCAGLRHREAGQTFVRCSPDCINSITVEQILEAVSKLEGA